METLECSISHHVMVSRWSVRAVPYRLGSEHKERQFSGVDQMDITNKNLPVTGACILTVEYTQGPALKKNLLRSLNSSM